MNKALGNQGSTDLVEVNADPNTSIIGNFERTVVLQKVVDEF